MPDKSTIEWRLVVTWPFDRCVYLKRSADQAHADASKYADDHLGRTVVVQSRTVTASPWQTQTP